MAIGVHLEPCRWAHQAHTSEEQLESESRPATERIPPYILIGARFHLLTRSQFVARRYLTA